MKKTIYQVDSFTEEPFKGNPAGVMILKESLTPELMQNIAKEMNVSETAFVNISESPFEIRFYSPTVEIPLCGHATLASAHILYEEGIVSDNETISFQSKVGLLEVTKNALGIKMVFPQYQINQIENFEGFSEVIGFTPLATYASDNNWKIAIAENEELVKNANPKFSEMDNHGFGQLMITSLSERKDIDFVVRCFAPFAGIDEDPVTGSAQCGLVPLWHLKTGKTEFKVEQVSERTGLLNVALVNDKVEIVGKAITMFKAEMNIY